MFFVLFLKIINTFHVHLMVNCPGGTQPFILVKVCGPKGRKWGLKKRVGTKNKGL